MTISATPSNVISSDRVEGTDVYNNAGDKLGCLNSVVFSAWVRIAIRCLGAC